jgi:hypothetical protein
MMTRMKARRKLLSSGKECSMKLQVENVRRAGRRNVSMIQELTEKKVPLDSRASYGRHALGCPELVMVDVPEDQEVGHGKPSEEVQSCSWKTCPRIQSRSW